MIELTSFFSGFLTAICSTAIAIYFFYKHYRKVVISADLDKFKDAAFYLIEALKDAKLSEEEKLTILNKLKGAITEETRVVRIDADEIKSSLNVRRCCGYGRCDEYHRLGADGGAILEGEKREEKNMIKI
ncbi:hypothetical protein J7J18_01000 [bacterium]|nr:hypothetical protein [bacterium]